MLTVMAAMAEFEARRIGQRIKEAFAARKARGLPPCNTGGWKVTRERLAEFSRVGGAESARRANEYRAMVLPVAQTLRDEGRTLQGVADALNERGVRTFQGKTWTLANVHHLLRNGD